jgi:hypothetical protein
MNKKKYLQFKIYNLQFTIYKLTIYKNEKKDK